MFLANMSDDSQGPCDAMPVLLERMSGENILPTKLLWYPTGSLEKVAMSLQGEGEVCLRDRCIRH